MRSSALTTWPGSGRSTVVDIMRTHPMVIIGGMLQRNPFYVPPEQFLLEQRRRTGPDHN